MYFSLKIHIFFHYIDLFEKFNHHPEGESLMMIRIKCYDPAISRSKVALQQAQSYAEKRE